MVRPYVLSQCLTLDKLANTRGDSTHHRLSQPRMMEFECVAKRAGGVARYH
jgi:hypothetical protein